jgi:hypothetical protein
VVLATLRATIPLRVPLDGVDASPRGQGSTSSKVGCTVKTALGLEILADADGPLTLLTLTFDLTSHDGLLGLSTATASPGNPLKRI